MKQDQLDQRLHSYSAWRERLIQTVEQFQSWLDTHDLASAEQELQIFEAIEALRKDRLTVAFVAEFSRGKTELINALFSSHYGQRLLPSDAGRTTMCPTELFYDRDEDKTYIHLLPIETRLKEQSIADLKHEPIHWIQIKLNANNTEQVAKALREVIKTKQIPVANARELGLYDESTDPYFQAHQQTPDQVEVPLWRHALISFPHELLKHGLVILDTPGLNALGNEPELTLNMLPAAQAVLFLLAADTGVTRSDMEMWQHYVRGANNRSDKNLIVVLNKIDTLWDDLKDPSSVNASIESQRAATAKQLQIDINRIFPVSAQKGLQAKIRNDQQLLQESRLGLLEDFLANEVLPGKQDIVRESLVRQIGGMIDENLTILESRKTRTTDQVEELRSLRGKNADVIMHLMSKSREEQATYLRNVESFQSSRRLLQNQARTMLDTLSLDNLDRLINKTRDSMTHSWTTTGVKRSMETFFDGTRDAMEQVSTHAEQTRMLIRATYKKFHEEHGLPQIMPKQFLIAPFSAELERLYQEAETFRRSPVTTMTEQSYIIKKFFISLVSHARSLFFKANEDANHWLKEVMNPLVRQIKEHKIMMEKRLDTLRRISESRDTIDARIKELDISLHDIEKQLGTLQQLQHSLNNTDPDQDISSSEAATSTQAEAIS